MAGTANSGAGFLRVVDSDRGDIPMVAVDLAIDLTMQTYAMMAGPLTARQELLLKAQLTSFLYAQTEQDEGRLTVAGLTFLKQLSRNEAQASDDTKHRGIAIPGPDDPPPGII